MNSSTGRFLIALFSTAVLIKEGISTSNSQFQKKAKDGSPKTQDGRNRIRGHGGRQLIQNPQEGQFGYGPPQVVVPPVPGYQSATETQLNGHEHGHARGEIHLDLSHLSEEMGIRQIGDSIYGLHNKVDNMLGIFKETIENEMINDLNPAMQSLSSKVDYLGQAVQTLQGGMQVMNDQMKAQQQVLQENIHSKCDIGSLEQYFQVLENSLVAVTQEVKQFRTDQSTALKAIFQQVAQNSEALRALQSGVTATFNSCRACSAAGPESQMGPIGQKIDDGINKMIAIISTAVPQNVRHALHDDLATHANTVMQHSAHGNEEIKSYLLELATKMMNYRDEYLKRLADQTKKMAVIKKTVTQTTQVMQQAAHGTEEAAKRIVSAQRSLENRSICADKKKEGK